MYVSFMIHENLLIFTIIRCFFYIYDVSKFVLFNIQNTVSFPQKICIKLLLKILFKTKMYRVGHNVVSDHQEIS